MRLAFAERGLPTVIQVKDSEIASRVTVWLRPSDGAVAKTTLDLTTPAGINTSITTEFSREPTSEPGFRHKCTNAIRKNPGPARRAQRSIHTSGGSRRLGD